ncbi:carbohydrate porin, partial [Klebsiella pneumoniae]|uniref:carbohydrate porin n=1 Tax=Klebsiella pneumoniae TaxID=573 RepID=UPI002271B82A
VFGAALWGTSGELSQDRFLELGFVQKGTFAGRDKDSIAFVVNRQRYSGVALENLRLQRAALGGGDDPAENQYLMELSYGIQVSSLLR